MTREWHSGSFFCKELFARVGQAFQPDLLRRSSSSKKLKTVGQKDQAGVVVEDSPGKSIKMSPSQVGDQILPAPADLLGEVQVLSDQIGSAVCGRQSKIIHRVRICLGTNE